MKRIPLLVPDVPSIGDILPFLREIDAARWYTNFGPLVRRFEQGIAHVLGQPTPEVTTVANCTLGLELSLTALGLKPRGKVLVPALTFVATASAVSRAGYMTVLSDIDPDTWLLTADIARSAASKTELSCVVPVAAFGCPHVTESWDEFTRDTGIPVLIDAAGAFGNQLVGRTTAVAYSFHATKAFGIGEGGAVAALDKSFIGRVRQLGNFGIDVSSGLAIREGTNAKMSEYHAAVGLAALQSWVKKCEARSQLHRYYISTLQDLCPDIGLQDRAPDGVYAILQIRLPAYADRAKVTAYLNKRGVESRGWYLPLLVEHPAISSVDIGDVPMARILGGAMLGLPFHPFLENDDVFRICTLLAEALQAAR